MNPQEQYPQNFGQPAQQPEQANNFFSSVQGAGANQLDVTTSTNGDTQMNVVNAVNANGVISGRKVVDYIWKRVAVCAIVIAGGFFVAVLVMIFIASGFNGNAIRQEEEKNAANEKLNEMYAALKVDSQEDALTTLGRDEVLSGSDIAQIHNALVKKYGSVTSFDPTATSQNLVKANGVYKVVSLKMSNAAGSNRAFLYARLADNQWKVAEYNAADEKNPCKNSSDEEKIALSGVVKCPSVVIEEDEE